MRLPIRDHRWLTLPLTVWFAVVACAVCVTHSHAGGSARHVHGCGWNVCGCPLDREPPDDGSEPHRHLVLFGVELPGEPLPDTVADELAVGLLVATDQPAVDVPADQTVPFVSESIPPVVVELHPFVPVESPRFQRSPRLSTVALRTLCGVLRA